jgi:ribosomal protein S18 acetylase RimI-like enzyme
MSRNRTARLPASPPGPRPPTSWELEDLFVDPGYRRRGIATALVSRIAEVLRARGVERLEVTANPHALGFYRAAGFVDCGVAETDFGAAPRMVLAIS